MPSFFTDANKAVVEAAYYRKTATPITVETILPSDPSDGVAVTGSSRGILGIKPEAGQTCDIEVYWYDSALDEWWHMSELDLTGVDGDKLGDSFKINMGGADRIYVRVLNLTGGTVTCVLYQARS